jgi:hypothetical protein
MDARTFALEWVAAWNARDLDRVLSHYAESIEFTSLLALRLVPESGGTMRGLEALRAYWTKGLAMSPNLHFDLLEIFETVSGCTVLYKNHRTQLVTETFFWNDDGRVVRSSSSYSRPTNEPSLLGGTKYCLIARIPAEGVSAFEHYEASVLPLLAEHGGVLERRRRTADGTTEIHDLRFSSQAGLDAYRSDPRREAARPMLEASRAVTELLEVEEHTPR